MSVEINDIGNGVGYLYITDASNTILTAEINTPQGYRNIKASGLTVSPIAARKSSVGTITIISADGASTIDDITVDGVTIIPSSIPVTSSTPSDVANDIVAYINSYLPAGPYQYTSVPNGATVDIIAPSDAGADPNGYVVDITITGATTATTTNMTGVSSNNGVIDDILGLKFWMYADPSATPNSLVGASEITKFMVMRGLQTGIIVKEIRVSDDGIYDIERSCSTTLVNVLPETSTTDVVAYIDPVGFVDGDMVLVRSANIANTITVESAPISTSPCPVKNIYLSGDLAFTADQYQTLTLQYRYIETVGACFVEANRSLSVVNSFNIYNTDGTLTGVRTLDGDSYGLTFQNLAGFTVGSGGIIHLANTDSPTSFLNIENDKVQINADTFLHAGNDHNVTVDNFDIEGGVAGLIGTSAGGVVARVGFGSGEIRLDASGNLTVYSGGVFKYKLPLTSPTNGQVLTCIDGAGTTAWV